MSLLFSSSSSSYLWKKLNRIKLSKKANPITNSDAMNIYKNSHRGVKYSIGNIDNYIVVTVVSDGY